MLIYISRILLSLVLIASGIGLAVYGIINTEVEVKYEVTEEVVLEAPPIPMFDPQQADPNMSPDMMTGMPPAMPGMPMQPMMPGMPMPPAMPGMPPAMPGMPPQPDPFASNGSDVSTSPESAEPGEPYAAKPKTETVTMEVVDTYREWKVIHEVTIGGLALEDGKIIRTYVGDPPALCPT